MPKPFRKDDESEDATDHMDFPDNTDEVIREKQVEYEYLCEIITQDPQGKTSRVISCYIPRWCFCNRVCRA